MFEFLSALVKPVTDLLGGGIKTEQDRIALAAKVQELQIGVSLKLLELESDTLKAQSAVVQAEAGGSSWLQKNWRPITMLTFLVLVVMDSLGVLPFRLATEAWELLKIGMGGYVIGRSVEKIGPKIAEVFKK